MIGFTIHDIFLGTGGAGQITYVIAPPSIQDAFLKGRVESGDYAIAVEQSAITDGSVKGFCLPANTGYVEPPPGSGLTLYSLNDGGFKGEALGFPVSTLVFESGLVQGDFKGFCIVQPSVGVQDFGATDSVFRGASLDAQDTSVSAINSHTESDFFGYNFQVPQSASGTDKASSEAEFMGRYEDNPGAIAFEFIQTETGFRGNNLDMSPAMGSEVAWNDAGLVGRLIHSTVNPLANLISSLDCAFSGRTGGGDSDYILAQDGGYILDQEGDPILV